MCLPATMRNLTQVNLEYEVVIKKELGYIKETYLCTYETHIAAVFYLHDQGKCFASRSLFIVQKCVFVSLRK